MGKWYASYHFTDSSPQPRAGFEGWTRPGLGLLFEGNWKVKSRAHLVRIWNEYLGSFFENRVFTIISSFHAPAFLPSIQFRRRQSTPIPVTPPAFSLSFCRHHAMGQSQSTAATGKRPAPLHEPRWLSRWSGASSDASPTITVFPAPTPPRGLLPSISHFFLCILETYGL